MRKDIGETVISATIILLPIFAALFLLCYIFFAPSVVAYRASTDVFEGIVTKKDIAKTYQSSTPQYNIYIEFQYDYYGSIKLAEKRLVVDKDTYLATNVGDWFNSRTLTSTTPSASPTILICSNCGIEATTNLCGNCGVPAAERGS